MEKQVAALFDIDGTIFRGSLLIEHFKLLLKYNLIPEEFYTSKIKNLEIAYKNREVDYEIYLEALVDSYRLAIIGLDKLTIDFTAEQTILNCYKKIYKFTKDEIKKHKEKGNKVIFISGSPDFLVNKMADKLNADLWFGSTYLHKNNLITGDVIPMWDSKSKENTINKLVDFYNLDLENSFAYGDTTGDFIILKSVKNNFAINPNKNLVNLLKENKLETTRIIVERKDMIYNLSVEDIIL